MPIAHEVRRRLVHFFGRNAGTDQLAYAIENVARGAASLPHLVNFLRVFNWDHVAFLSSINRETSSQITKSKAVRSLARIDIRFSACGSVRGKPSKTNP